MTDLADTLLRGGKRRLPMVGDASDEARDAPDAHETPSLLGLPAPIPARQGLHVPDRADLSPRAFAVLSAVRDALRAQPGDSAVFPLDELAAADRVALWDMLGEGEVSIVVQGTSRYEIEETALPGVYRVRTSRADGDSLHLEVGAVPRVVLVAAEHGTAAELPLEEPPPPGLMNAQPLLAELRHRMAAFASGDAKDTHVVSLSLLPLNEEDGAYLARALGVGPVQAESRGYGTCRVTATARRGIWAVQYFNVMGALILDTIEVGPVPAVVIAAPVDLEDSGARLAELLEGARGSL